MYRTIKNILVCTITESCEIYLIVSNEGWAWSFNGLKFNDYGNFFPVRIPSAILNGSEYRYHRNDYTHGWFTSRNQRRVAHYRKCLVLHHWWRETRQYTLEEWFCKYDLKLPFIQKQRTLFMRLYVFFFKTKWIFCTLSISIELPLRKIVYLTLDIQFPRIGKCKKM